MRDYAGLWNDHPVLAALMTIFLLSLGGFPPLAGFIAKWYVFSAAVKAGYTWLAIIGVLTSVVSVFFYLRIVVMMYMTPSEAAGAVPRGAADRRRRSGRLRRFSSSISASCRRASSTGPPRRSRRSSERSSTSGCLWYVVSAFRRTVVVRLSYGPAKAGHYVLSRRSRW